MNKDSMVISLNLLISKYEEEQKHLEDASEAREVGYRNGMNKGAANALGCVIRDLKNIVEGEDKDE